LTILTNYQEVIMQKKCFARRFLMCALVFLGVGFANQAKAQPSDAQVKKDLTHAKTVSVTLAKPGKIEWSGTYKKWVWTRNFTAKLKTDDPGIFVIVKGYASYDVMGGSYVFWKTFTTSNSYEGIPDPTAADVQALITKFGLEQFMGQYHFNHVIGKVESIGLAAEPKYVWHTPNSVSFNVVAVYTEKTNDIDGRERIARTLEIRLYRDSVNAPWKNLLSTDRGVEKL
jgi:hypothetical protein